MNCSYHPDAEATHTCSACGRDLCENCSHQIKDKFFCEDCLVQGAEWSSRMRESKDYADAPRRAAFLSIIPALGAIYNGQYVKAVTHFSVFAALCIMSDDVHEIFGWAAATFYFYMFFDSYRSAQQIRDQKLAYTDAPSGKWGFNDEKSPFWGILLILLGIVFTLNNLGIVSFYFIRRVWPLIFIVVGGYLVYRSFLGGGDNTSAASSISGGGDKGS